MHTNLRILYRTDARVQPCPTCGKIGTLKRSHSRSLFEKIVKLFLPITTFRCKECGWRGFKSAYVFKLASIKSLFFYLILFLGTAFIVSFILQRFILK